MPSPRSARGGTPRTGSAQLHRIRLDGGEAEDDTNVPVSQAIYFHRALSWYGAEHELVIYPREGHGLAERNHQLDLLRRTRAWFDRWLLCVAVAPAQGDRGPEPVSGQKPPDPDPDMPALLMLAPRARRTDRTPIGPGAEGQATRPSRRISRRL